MGHRERPRPRHVDGARPALRRSGRGGRQGRIAYLLNGAHLGGIGGEESSLPGACGRRHRRRDRRGGHDRLSALPERPGGGAGVLEPRRPPRPRGDRASGAGRRSSPQAWCGRSARTGPLRPQPVHRRRRAAGHRRRAGQPLPDPLGRRRPPPGAHRRHVVAFPAPTTAAAVSTTTTTTSRSTTTTAAGTTTSTAAQSSGSSTADDRGGRHRCAGSLPAASSGSCFDDGRRGGADPSAGVSGRTAGPRARCPRRRRASEMDTIDRHDLEERPVHRLPVADVVEHVERGRRPRPPSPAPRAAARRAGGAPGWRCSR